MFKRNLTNREMRKYVEQKQSFINGNKTCFGEWNQSANVYVVYSYGRHYPAFIFDRVTQQWFENSTRRSVTTSRHKTHCRPYNATIIRHLDGDQMYSLSRMGYSWLVDQRLQGVTL